MNILDENIVASQRAKLRKWRRRFSHIGTDIGRQGMKDLNELVPLLHNSRRPTFFTHDLGFIDRGLCHKDYSMVCLDVSAKETAVFIRRFLRHPGFRTRKQRLGKVILARERNLSFWEMGNRELQRIGWPKL